ncbi:MAG: dihydroorotase [Clostridia bacterium]|nr:dihydroorotase [Clostridia bacterium]
MNLILKNASVYSDKAFEKKNIYIADGKIYFNAPTDSLSDGVIFDFSDCVVIPGLTDVHVHLREPGFSYKETIKSGTCAAAAGGFTSVFSMPNLNPVPDSLENLSVQERIIEKDAVINVFPYASITVGEKGEELSDIENLSKRVLAFSDDGRGVQSLEMMKKAMLAAKKYNKIIAAHCEDNSLLKGGYIHDGDYAKKHGHRTISSESEYAQIERDIKLCKETGCKYHVCHISTKQSVELIRKAKADGVDISCETAPHYLILSDKDLREDGRFKMNPPLRDESDRLALIEGIKDGTIDIIATDHAPHSKEEKSKGLEKSNMGVVGIETAFPLMYTHFVKTGIITLEKLIELMCLNPNKRFCVPFESGIKESLNLTVFDLNKKYTVNSSEFLSMGRSTPFDGNTVYAKCLLTIANGKIAYENCSERKTAND